MIGTTGMHGKGVQGQVKVAQTVFKEEREREKKRERMVEI